MHLSLDLLQSGTPSQSPHSAASSHPMYFVFRLNEDDPVWLIILFTHHICLPNANTAWVFIQHHQFHYCFNIPVVDLTADIILTKLENLVKWVFLIPFLTEMLKNRLPALCSLFFAILIMQLNSKLVSLSCSEIFPFSFLLIFLGALLCKVVLVSCVQQSESAVCLCVCVCVCVWVCVYVCVYIYISLLFWISFLFRSTEDWLLEFPISVKVAFMSHSLWPRGLYSPWNSPGQNTGVGSLPFSKGSSQPRNWTGVSCIAGGLCTNWAFREASRVNYAIQ